MSFLRAHKLECAIFFLALAARVFYFGLSFQYHDGGLIETSGGADGYYQIAENIIGGHGYSSDSVPPYSVNSVRPPIFPYFLVFFRYLFGTYWAPLIALMLVGSVLPVLGMKISRYLTAVPVVPLIVGIVLALEPFSILFSIFFYSETVFMFLFFLFVLALFRYFEKDDARYLWASAFLLGLSVLTKPTAQYVWVIVAGLLLWHLRAYRKQSFIYAGVFCGIVFLTITPWLLRNYQEFGVAGISSQQGSNLYSVLVPSMLAVKNGTTFQQEFSKALAADATDPNQTDIAHSNALVKKAIPILLANPVPLAILCANTALNFFIHDGMYDVLKHIGYRPQTYLGKPALFVLLSNPGKIVSYIISVLGQPIILILVGRIVWILVTLAFLWALWRQVRHKPNLYAVGATLFVFYFMLTTLIIGLSVNARYRLPVDVFIVTFAVESAVIGAAWAKKMIKKEI